MAMAPSRHYSSVVFSFAHFLQFVIEHWRIAPMVLVSHARILWLVSITSLTMLIGCEFRDGPGEHEAKRRALEAKQVKLNPNTTELTQVVNSPANATGEYSLEDDETLINLSVYVTNLSSPVTAIHLHCAFAKKDGPIVYTIPLSAGTVLLEDRQRAVSFAEQCPLSKAAMSQLRAGEIYLDIHTQKYPNGELRCQLPPPS
ncbi:hypothetical protein B7486_12155 [cyanobacterium TDX16]|nr:hypothetical protein B7486_12155 [cyanobacterium TDX16]